MQITRNSLETVRGPADWSTGDLYIDTIASPSEASRVGGGVGGGGAPPPPPRGPPPPAGAEMGGGGGGRQTIWVSEGFGLCQREGGRVEVIRPGDRVFFEPGENHWHGAAPTRFMAHLAIQQADDEGNFVSYGERVSDEQYGQAPPLTEGEN